MIGSSYHWLPDWSKTSCNQELFLEHFDSLIDQQLRCDRELLSDLIDSLIDQKLLVIRSSFYSILTSSSTNKHVAIGSSYQSILTPWLIINILPSRALIRQHWLSDRPTSKLWSGALIGAHWLHNWSKTSCDQELFLELIDSLIDPQTCCDWELLSELIESMIVEIQVIGSSHQSSLAPRLNKNFLLFGELINSQTDQQTFCGGRSNQSLLTPWSIRIFLRSRALIRANWLHWSTNKLVVIGSSYQSSLSPRSTNPLNLWLTGKTFLHFF